MSAMSRPATLAEVARRASAGDSAFDVALRELLDHFYLHPDARQAAIDPEPEMLPDPRHNATLGAVGEHLARRWGLRIPMWTEHPSRFPDRPVPGQSVSQHSYPRAASRSAQPTRPSGVARKQAPVAPPPWMKSSGGSSPRVGPRIS